MVNLTRTGDAGRTRLSDMSEADKTDVRVEAYGHVDEANSVLGVVTALGEVDAAVASVLRTVQNELFDVGADLSTPLVTSPAWPPLRIEQASIDRLEAWCDAFSEPLPNLVSFILPGGTQSGAFLHLARTVVRRAARAGWAAARAYGLVPTDAPAPGGVNPHALTYLNRLSDLLFILARVANGAAGDVLWVPGAEREPVDARAQRQRDRIERAGGGASDEAGPDVRS